MSLALRPANRLFVAADLPAGVRTALGRVAREVAGGCGGRAVPDGALHLTLHFIGRVDPERGPGLAEAVARALAGPPMPTALGGLRARPGPARARLVAVDLADPDGALAARAARVSEAVAGALGTPPDPSPLWPHVTLVRLRRPSRVRVPMEPPLEHTFDISRAALYDSHQSPGGPPDYRELAAVELVPAP